MLFSIQIPKQDAAEFTPSGALIFDAYATGVGVYQYTLADGRIVNEYKSLDEVAKPQSLATIGGSWITVHHPPQFLTTDPRSPSYWKLHSVGSFLTPGTMDGRRVKTRGILYDQDVIDAVLTGELTEISMGYWQLPVASHGAFEGLAYELMQTDMNYNHGSLYEPGGGRLGPSIGVKLDGKEWRQHASNQDSFKRFDSKPKEKKTMIIDFGGVKVDVPDAQAPQVQQFLQAQDSKIQTVTQERDTAKGQLTTIQTLQSQQNADSAAQQAAAAIEAAGQVRAELMDSAKGILAQNYDFKGKPNRQIMADALAALGVTVATDASDDTVKASYDTALAFNKKKNADGGRSPAQQLLTQVAAGQGRTDGAGQAQGAYVPISQRTDGQLGDALVELERMNSHYNSRRPRAAAAGGAQ